MKIENQSAIQSNSIGDLNYHKHGIHQFEKLVLSLRPI
jgi:hypothetical protein